MFIYFIKTSMTHAHIDSPGDADRSRICTCVCRNCFHLPSCLLKVKVPKWKYPLVTGYKKKPQGRDRPWFWACSSAYASSCLLSIVIVCHTQIYTQAETHALADPHLSPQVLYWWRILRQLSKLNCLHWQRPKGEDQDKWCDRARGSWTKYGLQPGVAHDA